MSEIEESAHVAWVTRQNQAELLRRARENALLKERAAQTENCLRMARQPVQHSRKRSLCVRRFAAIEAYRTEHEIQIRHRRSSLLRAPQHGFRFGKTAQAAKRRNKLSERGRKRRPPRCRPLEPCQRRLGLTAVAQRHCKVRLDRGAGSEARSLFERGDRLARSPLQ